MRLIFMGTPQYTIPVLQLLKSDKHEITAVYTRPDKPSGRGREPAPPPVKAAALDLVRRLADFQPQAIVVAAYGQILPQSVLDIAPFGCLNIHPSLLPRFRGPAPVVNTLLEGDNFAGVSVMRLDAGMDSGPVFARAQIPVLEADDAVTLTAKLFEIGARMVLEVLVGGLGQKRGPEAQDGTLATVTREIVKEDGRIDWQKSALQIWRQVRAYQPWPQAYCAWQSKNLKILEARPWPGEPSTDFGRIVSLNNGTALVAVTGSGLLEILVLQVEGKKAMPVGEFIRGQRDFIGSRLE